MRKGSIAPASKRLAGMLKMPEVNAPGPGVVLSGSLVTLRPLTIDDAAITLRWRLGARAMYMQEGARTESDQRAWIAAHANEPGGYNFIQEYRGAPVGMVALHQINFINRSAVMG